MADHKGEPVLESVMDKISDKFHGGDSSSSSDSDDEKKKGSSSAAAAEAMIYGLFGRKRPVGGLPSASFSPPRDPAANNPSGGHNAALANGEPVGATAEPTTVELDLAIMGCTTNVHNESGAGIPLIDLDKLNGPERRKVVEAAIGRACESDGFFMVTNHGIPAGVVERMLRLAREFFHLPESERPKCYSDDPNKAIWMSTSFYVRTEEGSNWRDFLRLHCYPLESFVDQWPSNPPSSFRQVVGTYATEARPLALRLLEAISGSQSSRASYCLPITQTQAQPSRRLRRHPISISPATPTSFPAAASQPGPRGVESSFSPPPFILQKNDVKVEVMITDEATTDEDVSKLDLAIMAATFSLLVPTAINLDGLTSSWGTPWKEFYGIFLMISLVSTIIGLFTAASSRARSLSPSCARLGLVLATALFLLPIASKLGRFGCAAGVALAALVMLVLAVIWICGEQLTSRAAPDI